MNVAILMGRLTADPELKHTSNSIPVCSFTLAVDRRVKSGEERQTDFINIVAWRQTAEFVSKYFVKGQMIAVEGTIQTRRYQDKHGDNRTVFEVVADNVHFTGHRDTQSNTEAPVVNGAGDFSQISADGDLPF